MRLFVAVNLPADIRDALWESAASLRRRDYPVRWVSAEALHITVKFLGEVAADREAAIVAALERVVEGTKPFPLALSGFGAFPTVERPRIVWAGCEPAPSLELLQHGVELEMDRLGFPLEGRAFHPHVTLGRQRRGARPAAFRGFADRLGSLAFDAEVQVTSLDLMQSTLAPSGATYSRRHAAELVP
jgi:2'-5' RNA ligase